MCVFFIFGGRLDLRQNMGLGDLCALNGRFSSLCLLLLVFVMYFVSISSDGPMTSFDVLDDAIESAYIIIDELMADDIVYIYDDDHNIIHQYNGSMERC